MTMTKLTNLINPEVMAQMISAELPKKIKVTNLAEIDTTLVGIAGNQISVPKFQYIGDAEDLAEGVAGETVQLTASKEIAEIKKAFKGVELSDESVLSGYGDVIGETVAQLTKAIASKVDNDCMTALTKATLTHTEATQISYEGIVNAIDMLAEEDVEEKVLFVHSKQMTTLRKDPNFLSLDKYPVAVIMNGVVGSIAGCQVVVSNRVQEDDGKFVNPIVKRGALKIYLKRDVQVETDRDILKKTTVLTADEHFVAHLYDDSKVVVVKFNK